MFSRVLIFLSIKLSFWLSAAVFFSCSLVLHAEPVAWQKEGSKGAWFSQSSEHFIVHFQGSQQLLAVKALDIAEQQHTELQPFFDYSPSNKTEMVITDDLDVSNGWATFFPFAQIRLYSSPPSSINSLENIDDWFHLLIRHEYVHILHMESGRGDNKTWREIFGRFFLFFPHALTPSFMLEGLAVYLETDHSQEKGMGRSLGSFYTMQMRAEVASGDVKDLNQVIVPLRRMPLGANYLYGSYFYEYLAERFGQQKIEKFVQHYSRNVVPYFNINSQSQLVFGQSFEDLWPEFQTWLKDKYQLQVAQLSSEQKNYAQFDVTSNQVGETSNTDGLNQKIASLDLNIEQTAMAASIRGDLYLLQNNGEDKPELLKLSQQQDSEIQSFADINNLMQIDVNDQGQLVAVALTSYVDGRQLSDMYFYQDDEWQAFGFQQRFRHVRWLDNEWLIASRIVAGVSELYLINKRTGFQRMVWQGENSQSILGDFVISPNKKWLVTSFKPQQQGWNLYRINIEYLLEKGKLEKHWQALTDTLAVENSPSFDGQGNIIYSADYKNVALAKDASIAQQRQSRVFNIYRLNPNTGQVGQLSKSMTGVFQPLMINNENSQSQLIYQQYTQKGYQLVAQQLPIKPNTFNIDDIQGKHNYPAITGGKGDKAIEKSAVTDYSPWSSLRPRYWLPQFYASDEMTFLGAQTSGSDALSRHVYQLASAYNNRWNILDLNASYNYSTRWTLFYSQTHSFNPDVVNQQGKQTGQLLRDQQFGVVRTFNNDADDSFYSSHWGILHKRLDDVARDDLAEYRTQTSRYNISGRAAYDVYAYTWRYDNRQSYLNSPASSWGIYWDFMLDFEGGDFHNQYYRGSSYQTRLQRVFDLPGRNTLALTWMYGVQTEEASRFSLGGSGLADEEVLINRRSLALRGYASRAQQGNNYQLARLNFKTFLHRFEQNWGFYPIGLGDLSLSLFSDYGSAWFYGDLYKNVTNGKVQSGLDHYIDHPVPNGNNFTVRVVKETAPDYLIGVGAELSLEIILGYNIVVPLKVGYAKGLHSVLGKDQFYTSFAVSF